MNDNIQNPSNDSIGDVIDKAVERATSALSDITPKRRWGWKRISVVAGVAVVATAATYVGVKVMGKPKAVAAVADAATAVADAVVPAA